MATLTKSCGAIEPIISQQCTRSVAVMHIKTSDHQAMTYITNHFNDKYSPNVVSKGNKMMHLNIVRCHAHILSIIQDKEDRRVAVTKGAHFLNMDLCTISPNCIKNVNFYVHFYPEWKLVHMILLLSATKMWYN